MGNTTETCCLTDDQVLALSEEQLRQERELLNKRLQVLDAQLDQTQRARKQMGPHGISPVSPIQVRQQTSPPPKRSPDTLVEPMPVVDKILPRLPEKAPETEVVETASATPTITPPGTPTAAKKWSSDSSQAATTATTTTSELQGRQVSRESAQESVASEAKDGSVPATDGGTKRSAVVHTAPVRVVLKREGEQWAHVGLTLFPRYADTDLQVEEVWDLSLISVWNKQNPQSTVSKGDVVKSVNGVSGQTEQMIVEIARAVEGDIVELMVLRGKDSSQAERLSMVESMSMAKTFSQR